MEWLINRRRMMFNRVIPIEYLTFEDTEFWRICCENFGDYNETVITDNGDNTVNIVTTYKSMLTPEVVYKSNVVSSQSNVDNSGGTYVAGTTKEAVGITQNQCNAITWLGKSSNRDNRNYFGGNTNILSLNDLQYFTNLTELRGNDGRDKVVFSAFSTCSNCTSVILPDSLTTIGGVAFYNCTSLQVDNFNNVTIIGGYAFRGVPISSFVPKEGFTSIGYYALYASGCLYYDFPSTTTNISKSNIVVSQSIVVCRATTPPTLGTGNTYASAYYVPSASIDDYKAASNWSSVATKIQAIEGTWYETHRSLEPTT